MRMSMETWKSTWRQFSSWVSLKRAGLATQQLRPSSYQRLTSQSAQCLSALTRASLSCSGLPLRPKRQSRSSPLSRPQAVASGAPSTRSRTDSTARTSTTSPTPGTYSPCPQTLRSQPKSTPCLLLCSRSTILVDLTSALRGTWKQRLNINLRVLRATQVAVLASMGRSTGACRRQLGLTSMWSWVTRSSTRTTGDQRFSSRTSSPLNPDVSSQERRLSLGTWATYLMRPLFRSQAWSTLDKLSGKIRRTVQTSRPRRSRFRSERQPTPLPTVSNSARSRASPLCPVVTTTGRWGPMARGTMSRAPTSARTRTVKECLHSQAQALGAFHGRSP
mmetsp:Transcript_35144/g.80153  ORF Transcript_35144/g.80153 Transcript_35144/m.80153 type:complete len:333 (+) Transcript_35144:1439-2437(+)